MALNLIIAALLATAVALVTCFLMRRQAHAREDAAGRELADAKTALSIAKADFEARQEGLRKSINEARERENEAKTKAEKSDQQYADMAAELKITLEEKGQFQNEATRVVETKETLLEREKKIESLNDQIADLRREKN
jgi:chromosome segregation ATPase